jgi:hypothetical protein
MSENNGTSLAVTISQPANGAILPVSSEETSVLVEGLVTVTAFDNHYGDFIDFTAYGLLQIEFAGAIDYSTFGDDGKFSRAIAFPAGTRGDQPISLVVKVRYTVTTVALTIVFA